MDATDANPYGIVSEQHDASRINWVGGVTDPGEMIGCGKYQILRRLNGEADDVYQARLESLLPTLPAADREKIENDMRAAAIARAGLDMSNGRANLYTAGELPWMRLGVNVREALNSKGAAELSGLSGWTADKRPLYYKLAAPKKLTAGPLSSADNVTIEWEENPDAFAVVRSDTQRCIGTVGRKYECIQNPELFAFTDAVLKHWGARYESAGSLYGGSKVFLLAQLPSLAFKVGAGDWTEAYALFTNSHDGSETARFMPTSNRVVCANTRRIALRCGKGKGFAFRHTLNVRDAMKDAEKALEQAADGFRDYATTAETMARKQLASPVEYFDGLLDAVSDITAADMAKSTDLLAAMIATDDAEKALAAKKIERQKKARGGLLEDMIERWEQENNRGGSVFHALNVATEAVDHGPLGGRFVGSDEKRASSRFDSVLSGRGDDIKQEAYTRAVAMLS
jgi:phage/plasmid-like protein (TIGR03299 family)